PDGRSRSASHPATPETTKLAVARATTRTIDPRRRLLSIDCPPASETYGRAVVRGDDALRELRPLVVLRSRHGPRGDVACVPVVPAPGARGLRPASGRRPGARSVPSSARPETRGWPEYVIGSRVHPAIRWSARAEEARRASGFDYPVPFRTRHEPIDGTFPNRRSDRAAHARVR